jgi:hypothetical protein
MSKRKVPQGYSHPKRATAARLGTPARPLMKARDSLTPFGMTI